MELAIIPDFIIRRLSRSRTTQYDCNVLLSILLLLIVFGILKEPLHNLLKMVPHFCFLEETLGIKCPGCDMTGGLIQCFRGNFSEALALNAASVLVAIFYVLQIPIRIVSLLSTNKRMAHAITKSANKVTLAAILLNWIFNL